MADIDFYGELDGDTSDDGYGLDEGLDSDDAYSTDDKLTPLQKLEKYMQSENVYTRQMVARGLLDTLRAVEDKEDIDDCTAVLNAMLRLSEDSDPIVRSELMEQVPHLAVYCHNNPHMFNNAVPSYVLPMVVRYLNDSHTQVRKTSQAALLVLLEQELISRCDIEEQVVSVILDLASPDSHDDFRTEAVALMSKMAPLLGQEMTEREFLPRFCEMCTDPLFHVRKVCAGNFGDMCTVVGQSNTENHLLSKFAFLCEDGVWGVRKACAECFMAVSCSCSPEVRRGELSKLFVNLLCDLSRWVRMAAFQQLGPFISTFADPSLTGLYVNDEGILVVKDPEKLYALENFEKLRDFEGSLGEEGENSSPEEEGGRIDNQNISSKSSICDNQNTEDMDITDLYNDPSSMGLSRLSIRGLEGEETEKSPEEVRAEDYAVLAGKADVNRSDATEGQDNSQIVTDIDSEEGPLSEDPAPSNNNQDNSCDKCDANSQDPSMDIRESDSVSSSPAGQSSSSSNEAVPGDSPSIGESTSATDTTDFNSFQYWRPPLPEVDIDLDIINNGSSTSEDVRETESHYYTTDLNLPSLGPGLLGLGGALSPSIPSASASDPSHNIMLENLSKLSSGEDQSPYTPLVKEDSSDLHNASIHTATEQGETICHIGSTHVLDYNLGYVDSNLLLSLLPLADFGSGFPDTNENIDAQLAQQQDIVPQSLLESYLGMVDPSRAQTVDTEITKHCAYNLPAVAYTLGRKNWNCIKSLYEVLASDMQWKVRRTLAFSIHEMALILGEDITQRDLVPIFDGFLKDLDEVRIGVLKHLADFLKLLRPECRRQYLTKVECFMNTDNCRNWRFRLDLAEQLMLTSELFSAEEVSQFLLPLGVTLAEDKVSEVRHMAFRLLSVIMKRLRDGDQNLMEKMMKVLVEKFALSNKWCRRQVYPQLLQFFLEEDSVPLDMFVQHLVPNLVQLASDTVPNVRICVAKALSSAIFVRDYFFSPKNPQYESLSRCLQQLQSDEDRDVKFFAHPQPEETTPQRSLSLEEEEGGETPHLSDEDLRDLLDGDVNRLPV